MAQRHRELASKHRSTGLLRAAETRNGGHMSTQHAGLSQVPADQPGTSSSPTGTWTIDPAHSGVSLTWPTHRLGPSTARRRCFGVIHLDALPPVGVVRFEQRSGLPVLTLALDAESGDPQDTDVDAMPAASAGRSRHALLGSGSTYRCAPEVW